MISSGGSNSADMLSDFSKTDISAFDIFDTVLTRVVGSPQAVFHVLGKRLLAQGLISCTPEMFCHARIEAEGRAHNHRGCGISATLEGIYAELCPTLEDLRATPEQLMAAECQLEAELLRPVPAMLEIIQHERQKGKKIIFISDMYLPPGFIFEQLLKHKIALAGDDCYVSVEHRQWKRNGGLFREVLRKENISSGQLTFWGNDYNVDIETARKLAIPVKHFEEGNLNRYEASLAAQGLATGGLASIMAGASRLARLNVRAISTREADIRDFAASVVAPTLVSYTIWLLLQAKKRGLTRLYFLSRDGEILLKIAKVLAPKLEVTCGLHYLYASRKAWGMASICNADKDELAWLLEGDPGPDMNRLLSRLEIPLKEVRPALEKLGFAESRWSERFSQADLALLKSTEFIEIIRPYAMKTGGQRRELLLQYLEQEGLLANSNYGIVDVGWHASLQDCLARVLATRNQNNGTGFYFGLTSYQTAGKFGAKEAYFVDAQKQMGFNFPIPDLFYLIESMCAGTEGTLSAFALSSLEGKVKPVLKSNLNQTAADWGLGILHKTIMSFAQHLVLDSELVAVTADLRGVVARNLETFWLSPSPREARLIADFPFEGGMDNDVPNWKAAKEYTWNWVFRSLIRGRILHEPNLFWQAGSLSLTSSGKKKFLRLATKMGEIYRASKLNFLRRFKVVRKLTCME